MGKQLSAGIGFQLSAISCQPNFNGHVPAAAVILSQHVPDLLSPTQRYFLGPGAVWRPEGRIYEWTNEITHRMKGQEHDGTPETTFRIHTHRLTGGTGGCRVSGVRGRAGPDLNDPPHSDTAQRSNNERSRLTLRT